MNTDTVNCAPGFWRKFFGFALVRIIAGFLLIGIVVSLVQLPFNAVARTSPRLREFLHASLLPGIIAAGAAIATYYFFVRWTERRRVSELNFAGAIPELAAGAALGATMFVVTIAILWATGTCRFAGFGVWQPLITAFIAAGIGAIVEELLFRGVIFRIAEQSLGTWIALAISAILFGAIHFLNPNSGLLPAIAIAFEAGVFLAAAYLLTRRLWFVIGAHFGWNFTEGGIFGLSVSGHQAQSGLVHGSLSGPILLSGGPFGVEASIIAVLVCVTVAVTLIVYTARRGKLIAPFWARAGA